MLTPATIALIIQAIQAAITEAPQVKQLILEAKDFISSLFSEGLITKAQQDAIHAHVDAICAAALAGQEPPEWQIEPDPE